MKLPQEIIDIIIGHLHDDRPSLRACALVCSNWTYSCQSHLYSRIRLTGTEWPSNPAQKEAIPITQLLVHLRTTPHLARFVRHLEIIEGDNYITNRWLLDSVELVETLLPSLPNVHTFLINFRSLSWKSAFVVKKALGDMFQHPELRLVTICGIIGIPSLNRLFTLFGDRSRITDLHLVNIQTKGLTDESRTYAPKSVKLPVDTISLSLSSSDIMDLADWITDPRRVVDFTGFRKLRICVVEPSEIRAASRLMEMASVHSVDTIEIQLDDLDPTDSRQCSTLPNVSRFRHVILTLTSECIRLESCTSASAAAYWWARIFESTHNSAIEAVTLTFPKPDSYPLPASHKAHWNALDKALARPDMGKLKKVYLNFGVGCSCLQTAAIKEGLPKLYMKGLLVF